MKVSIALCTWNGARYLRAQLQSILVQERMPDELVIRDDGSTDETLDIARKMLENAPFHVDIATNDQNLGSTKNFEVALRACSGEVLFPCDQDDVWKPDKIRVCLEVLDSSGADLVFHDSRLVDISLRPIGLHWRKLALSAKLLWRFANADDQLPFLLRQPFVTGCCLAIRRESFEMCVPFGDGWIHDEWMAMVLAAHKKRLHPFADVLVDYRQHPVQQVGIENTRLQAKIRRILAADQAAYLSDVEKIGKMESFLSSASAPESSLALLQARQLHNRRRAVMGDTLSLRRWRMIWEELHSGRYRAYSWWKLAPLKDAARITCSTLWRHSVFLRSNPSDWVRRR